jgi:hypothetical protein
VTIVRPTGTVTTSGGGGAPGGGSVGGAVSAAAGAAGIGGSGTLDLPQAGINRVRVDLSTDAAHDRIELHLWRGSKLADTEPGSVLTIALGDDGSDSDVLTGEVAGIVRTAAGSVLTAYAPSRRLSSTFVARTYLRQTVADVVSDLLATAEVAAGEIEAPRELPALHVDGRRSVWSHLHRLADLIGAQVTTGVDGSLSFAPAPGATPAGGGLGGALGAVAGAVGGALGLSSSAALEEGVNLLAWRTGPRRSEPEPVAAVVALGAASTVGANRWYHVESEPDDGTELVTVAPVARDQDLAEAASTARTDAARRRRVTGRFRVPGDPELRAGATLTVGGTDYRTLVVRHLLVHDEGYLCDVVVEGM